MQKWPWKLNQIVNIKNKKEPSSAKEQKPIKQKPIKKPLKHQIDALYAIISKLYGPDLFKTRVNKLQVSSLMKSENLCERVLGLERLIYNDEKLKTLHSPEDLTKTVSELQDMIVDVLARKQVEEDIERKVQTTIQKKQQKYIQDVRRRVLKEENGPETAQTKAHLEKLEKLEARKLARSAAEIVRPQHMDEIVGQKKAVKALVAKMASPYPQHMIFYGPPGVGKTTAARLALEHVKKITGTAFSEEAPFIEVDGSTLRWDPRGITNPLLGSVHDPIYQGTRRDFAESGIPEPKLGLVSDAHGGVLFIDEIGEVDMILQNKLLKVLEDKRVFFESSYYDPTNHKIPEYIKRLFSEGAPADFVLIAATTRRPEAINPALRSRSTEIFFDALTPLHIQHIVKDAAVRLGVALEEGVPEFISEYTIEGRKAVNMLIDAFSLAAYQARDGMPLRVKREHLLNAIQTSRSFRYVRIKAEDTMRIGKVMGLGVHGFLGSALEIECAVFPAFQKGKGHVRFNETAGSMAKDSVFNAASVLRKLTDKELSDYDVHVNVVGGGNIDGPSAGVAISMAIYSALIEKPLRQDVAVTGEISLQGYVKPVGGVLEKIYGAQQAGMKKVLIPRANADEIPLDTEGLNIVLIDTIEEALNEIIVEG